MVQGGSRLSFPLEPTQGLRIAGNFIGQELQGYETVQPCILGFVDDTHSSATDFLDDAVVRNGTLDHWRKMLRPRNRQVNESCGVGGARRLVSLTYRRRFAS